MSFFAGRRRQKSISWGFAERSEGKRQQLFLPNFDRFCDATSAEHTKHSVLTLVIFFVNSLKNDLLSGGLEPKFF